MVAAKATQRYTPEEYLALERRSETRSEYINGCIVAMSGGTKRHNTIALNTHGALERQLGEQRCDVYAIDVKVRTGASRNYTYPDVVVACADDEVLDDVDDIVLNPTVIIEVLSPSTASYDRGDKFADYRLIPSLQEYVLIAQDRPSVEHYLRQGDQWLLTAVTDSDGTISLPTIGCTLPLREVYRRVRFDAAPAV